MIPAMSFHQWLARFGGGLSVPERTLANIAWNSATNQAAKVAHNRDQAELADSILRLRADE